MTKHMADKMFGAFLGILLTAGFLGAVFVFAVLGLMLVQASPVLALVVLCVLAIGAAFGWSLA